MKKITKEGSKEMEIAHRLRSTIFGVMPPPIDGQVIFFKSLKTFISAIDFAVECRNNLIGMTQIR